MYSSPELLWSFAIWIMSPQTPPKAASAPHTCHPGCSQMHTTSYYLQSKNYSYHFKTQSLPNCLSGKLGNCASTCCKTCKNHFAFAAWSLMQSLQQCLLPPWQHPSLPPTLHISILKSLPQSLEDKTFSKGVPSQHCSLNNKP